MRPTLLAILACGLVGCSAPVGTAPPPPRDASLSDDALGDLSPALSLLSPEALPERSPVPAGGARREWRPVDATGDRLRLRAGEAIRLALRTGPGARLRARVELGPDARLTVRSALDHSPGPLVEQRWPRALPLDVPLRAGPGVVTVLEFEAAGGPVTLISPVVVGPRQAAPAEALRPNILVFLSDTLRADHLRAFTPDAPATTPALDSLVATGLVFEQAMAPVNWTKPSVATVLTGLEPWQHGTTTHTASLPSEARMLSEYLSAAGYYTGAFSANGYISSTFGFQRGFETWRGHAEGPVDADSLSRGVVRWLARRPRDRPFFLYVHTTDCHAPYRASPLGVRRFDPGTYRGPVDFRRHPRLLTEVRDGGLTLSERDLLHLRATYDAAISYQDAALGRILSALDREGLAADTVVVFVADHGEEFLDHGSVGHGPTLWRELVHIPLVLRVPGVAPGRSALPVGSSSIAPTLLALARVRPEPEVNAPSLLALAAGLVGSTQTLPAAKARGWEAISTGRYKLAIRHLNGERRLALYDDLLDPAEQRDVATDHPLLVHVLERTLALRFQRQPAIGHRAVTVDATLESQLRALGYVGSQRAD